MLLLQCASIWPTMSPAAYGECGKSAYCCKALLLHFLLEQACFSAPRKAGMQAGAALMPVGRACADATYMWAAA